MFTITFVATVQIRQTIDAASREEAEAFAATVLRGEAIASTDDLLRAIDIDSLEITELIDIDEQDS